MINKIPAKKIGMTSAFDGAGTTLPVTLVQPFPVVITEIKRPEKHGYAAIKIAYDETLPKHLNKPHKGELQKAGIETNYRRFYEARVEPEALEGVEVGQVVDIQEMLKAWGNVKVTAISKGKGFAGAMKRWGFAGQARTHGDPDNRRPQSGGATDAARQFKGSRRPGRMGGKKVTVKGLNVFEYDAEMNLLAISGSVPGANGSTMFITLVKEREAIPAEEG